LLIGADLVESDVTTNIGEEIGAQTVVDGTYTGMIVDFAKIYNSLQIDVLQLVDQSRDRTATLDKYLEELKFNVALARKNIATLNDEAKLLSDKSQKLTGDMNVEEEKFFDKLKFLDAIASNVALENFISISQELVRVKAEYKARAKLLEYYNMLLNDTELRIKEIELNREAIIKGIKVVDVKGSNIELIINESAF